MVELPCLTIGVDGSGEREHNHTHTDQKGKQSSDSAAQHRVIDQDEGLGTLPYSDEDRA
ncbi:hypothetical protein GCM10011610_56000 [Nocardia rhizosphaerihabitans]|uniref:Uncharacterized protein n=2 Tax=Nocardia rhizosphaerihabitans TaxID=1691570 RepID=A0ABQ2KUI4_9NOCA|nr:hypothetical protein GCM10011610_56000 [Nocardia rhizosphaerihabitans]